MLQQIKTWMKQSTKFFFLGGGGGLPVTVLSIKQPNLAMKCQIWHLAMFTLH